MPLAARRKLFWLLVLLLAASAVHNKDAKSTEKTTINLTPFMTTKPRDDKQKRVEMAQSNASCLNDTLVKAEDERSMRCGGGDNDLVLPSGTPR